jgi:hypothetical protein
MLMIPNPVEGAVDRWVERGLLARDTTELLRAEMREEPAT